MPIYEFECEGCGHRLELLLNPGEVTDIQVCPRCKEDMDRIFSTTKIGQGRPEMIEQPSAHTPTWKRERFRKDTEAQNRKADKDFRRMTKQVASGRNPSANV